MPGFANLHRRKRGDVRLRIPGPGGTLLALPGAIGFFRGSKFFPENFHPSAEAGRDAQKLIMPLLSKYPYLSKVRTIFRSGEMMSLVRHVQLLPPSA